VCIVKDFPYVDRGALESCFVAFGGRHDGGRAGRNFAKSDHVCPEVQPAEGTPVARALFLASDRPSKAPSRACDVGWSTWRSMTPVRGLRVLYEVFEGELTLQLAGQANKRLR